MRLIWSTDQLDLLRKFSRLLEQKGIEYTQDELSVKDWGSETYGNKLYQLWVQNEDQVEEARGHLTLFLLNPDNPEFSASHEKEQAVILPSHPSRVSAAQFLEKKLQKNSSLPKPKVVTRGKERLQIRLTNFLIMFCSFLFLMISWSEKNQKEIPAYVQNQILTTSPIEKAFLFDYPLSCELADQLITLYGYKAFTKPNDLPPPGKFLYETQVHTPTWNGIYPWLTKTGRNLIAGNTPIIEPIEKGELFEKIRQGEIWRLETPILLHGDILHLFFNMIWLLLIGVQLEGRVGSLRFLLFILIVGLISNVSQYLISGPAFIGFSGVICGMIFFIRKRQKIAPWEGYLMSQGTYTFILFFIGTLAALSFVAFFVDIFSLGSFPIRIANTAHIVGAATGYFLARFRFFAWHSA